MKVQSERDRVDKRVLESNLRKMTEDRDDFKQKFLETEDKLNQAENDLITSKYEYDKLTEKFEKLNDKYNMLRMENEDYRSYWMNYDYKFAELKKWEKELRELEKELRAIKKRGINPYDFVDFNDIATQTGNSVKDKG